MQNEKIISKCDEIILSEKHKLTLHRFYEFDYETNKKYITDLSIVLDNANGVTNNFSQTILFREELNLFYRGDVQNNFFEIVSRKINQKEIFSLALTKKDGTKIYLSRAEVNAIVSLVNYSLQGFSLSRLYHRDISEWYGLYYR